MSAYDASEWTDFFVAGAGASAALAGLVFVAVSINIERILQFRGLPERALATVLLLLSVLLVSLIGLFPGQTETALALELLGVSLVLTGLILSYTSPGRADHDRSPAHVVSHWLLMALGTYPAAGRLREPARRDRRGALLDRGGHRLGDRRRRRERLGAARRDPAIAGVARSPGG